MLCLAPLIGLAFGSAFPPSYTNIYPQSSMVHDGRPTTEYQYSLLFRYELPIY